MTIYSRISANRWKTILLFFVFIILIIGFFYAVGLYNNDSNSYLIIGLLVSSVSSFISYFFADSIVLLSVGAKPADKKNYFDYYTVTENLAAAAGMPMPRLYVIQDQAPNAFATGRNPKKAVVCVTTGLLSILDRTELEGVISHELSHIRNYDMVIMTMVSVLVGTIALVSDWLLRSFWWRGRDRDEREGSRSPIMFVLFLVAMIIGPIVATLIQLTISRRREYLADADGALLTRYPEGLARALEKISQYPGSMRSATSSTAHLFIQNPFTKGKGVQWLTRLFSTHPPIEERIQLLREM